MDRGASIHPLSWLTVPVAGVLIASALTLPVQPYTGVQLRGERVAHVAAGSPGAAAGLAAGDQVWPPDETDRERLRAQGRPTDEAPESALIWQLLGPLDAARPGRATSVTIARAGERRDVTLIPDFMPPNERRLMTALLALASGFMLLGGWVWSERRDRLTRPFFLLSLAFAVLFAPPPRFGWPLPTLVHALLFNAAQLVLPALFIHFFALFPEPRAPRGRLAVVVTIGYAVAASLFAISILAHALRLLGPEASSAFDDALSVAATLWFGVGMMGALALFVRSYLLAGRATAEAGGDARRRLRVALIGTLLGLAPLVAVIVLRNLSPSTAIPGERGTMLLVLLVPLSFAWAIVVHRIFDFRVALRAGAVASVVTLIAAVLLGIGEWLASASSSAHGTELSGVTLALVALGASLAGPGRPFLAGVRQRLLHTGHPPAVAARLAAATARRVDSSAELLERACDAAVEALRIDRCAALEWNGTSWRVSARAPAGVPPPGLPDALLARVLAGRTSPLPTDDTWFPPADRDMFEAWGARWVLPVGVDAPAAILLLGRRLAGPWLDRPEVEELDRFAAQIAIALENLTLRRAARSHGEIDRELVQAGAIQAHLLPRRAPVYPTLDCAAATLSSEAVGGDYYDFVEREDREFTLVVGDAAGKGVPAALVLADVRTRFRHEAVARRQPSEVLRALNEELVHLDQPEKFMGLLCARVDVRSGRIWFANAGLTPPLVRRRSGACEEITAGGLLLGVRTRSEYADTCVQLWAGDVALVYTDGLTEASRGGELFGTDRVRRLLDRHAHRRAADLLERVIDEVRAFADGPLDDLTVLVLKQLADPAPDVPVRTALPLKWRLASADNSG